MFPLCLLSYGLALNLPLPTFQGKIHVWWGLKFIWYKGCSVAKLCMTLCDPVGCSMPGFSVLHHLWVCPSSCPLNRWCHPAISSSVIPFSSYLQSFPESGSFPMSWLFISGGQSIGASASVLPMSIQGWFPLGWTGLTSLRSQGLSRVFPSTTIWKHPFFSAQSSSWSNSHIHKE